MTFFNFNVNILYIQCNSSTIACITDYYMSSACKCHNQRMPVIDTEERAGR